MKPLVFLLMVVLAPPAWAQDKPASKDEKPQAADEKTKAEQPKKQAAAASRTKQRRWNEDARHCLERPTNTEIIKCAEEYL